MSHIKSSLDGVETLLDPVDPPRLTRNLRLEMPNLSHDVAHCGLERGYSRFDLDHLTFDLVDRTPDVPKVLHDDVVWFISHGINLANLDANSHQRHSASAPEMISISSLVIMAWRVRLYLSVCSRIISPALRVALSMAVMRAPCSDAAFSSKARNTCTAMLRGSRSVRMSSSSGSYS